MLRWAKTILILCLLCSPLVSAAEEAQPLRFGALTELSGPGALNGEACLLGYKIAEKLFRHHSPELSKRVEVIIGDHRREQKAAISEFQRLHALGVLAVAANHGIIGVAINPLSQRFHIPLFGVMGHESFVRDNPYALRIIATPQQEGGGLAQQAYRDGARKAAILVLEDDYILSVAKAFETEFARLGGKIVYKDFFEERYSDFGSIASRIRDAQPDVIAMTLGFQQFGPALKRLREQGVKQPIYSNYWLSYPQVIQSAGKENVEGSVFITEKSDFPVFLQAYDDLAPKDYFRSGVVCRCYSALASALAVLEANPRINSSQDYLRAVQGMAELRLHDRVERFKNREVQFDMELYRLRDGQPVLLQ